jgi:hypothetical protein
MPNPCNLESKMSTAVRKPEVSYELRKILDNSCMIRDVDLTNNNFALIILALQQVKRDQSASTEFRKAASDLEWKLVPLLLEIACHT